jgi:SnoaL-like domain
MGGVSPDTRAEARAALMSTPASNRAELHPYRRAFAGRDLAPVLRLLADDVVFHSPVIAGQGFEGRDSVAVVLAIALEAITDVEYTHEVGVDGARILVANGRVLGKPIKSTTLLELDPDGKIREIWVMARPLTGVVAIAEAVGSELAKRQGPGRAPALRALSKPLAALAAVTDSIGSGLIAALNRSGTT